MVIHAFIKSVKGQSKMFFNTEIDSISHFSCILIYIKTVLYIIEYGIKHPWFINIYTFCYTIIKSMFQTDVLMTGRGCPVSSLFMKKVALPHMSCISF